ncbi:MAG: PqqD family protein [Caenibius sp.]
MPRLRKVHSAFMSTDLDGELIMIDGKTGAFFALKGVGLAIWRKLDDEPELDRICASLQATYDVEPAVCRDDVQTFAEHLVTTGFAEYF